MDDYRDDHIRILKAKVEKLESHLRVGKYMRERQKGYFKDRTQKNLVETKQAEAAFDKVLEMLK